MAAVCQVGFSKKNVFGTFHTSGEPIFYMPIKFRENILIGGRDMLQNEIPKQPFAGKNSTSGSCFDSHHPSGTFFYTIVKILRNRSTRG